MSLYTSVSYTHLNKPSAGLILALIALPIVLIIINSVCSVVLPADNFVAMFFAFVGNNNVALFIACLLYTSASARSRWRASASRWKNRRARSR